MKSASTMSQETRASRVFLLMSPPLLFSVDTTVQSFQGIYVFVNMEVCGIYIGNHDVDWTS